MGFATHLFIVPPDQPVDDSFICGICHDVFDNATNLNACGHTFCRLCVIAVVESASSMNCCPICRKVFDIHQSHPNYTVNNLIGRMMIKCKRCIITSATVAVTEEEEENDGNGSNAAAAAAAAAEEEKMPPAKKLRMDEGGDDDNDAVVTASQTKEDETPVAASTAAAAASSIVPQQQQTQQDQVNLGCTWTGKVSDWYKHTKHDCSYEEITCPARGCTHRCTRKQLSQHMADSVERHLVLNMNSQIAELRREFSLRLEAFRTSIISGQASAIPPPSTIIITEAGCPEVNGTYRKVNIVHPTTTATQQQQQQQQPPSNILCQYVQEKKNEQTGNPSNSNTTGGPSSSTSNHHHHHHHHHDPSSSSSSENIGSVSGNYRFSINLCTMRNGNCAWTIGIPFEEQPGTDRDLDFYRSQTMEKSLAIKIGAPPAVWKCDSYGRNPLPKMEYIV